MAGTRYFRYLVFAFLCICIVLLFSSSSTPAERLRAAATDRIKSPWTNQAPVGAGSPPQDHPHDGYKAAQHNDAGDDSQSSAPAADYRQTGMPASSAPAADAAASSSVAHDAPVDASATPAADKDADATAATTAATAGRSVPPSPEQTKEPSQEDTKPPSKTPAGKMNATFVTLARNGDVWELSESIRHVEDRFNRKFNYDWVFLNDEEFDDNFKKITTALVSGKTKYGLIPKKHWGYPDWIDQDKARQVRKEMEEKKIIYGGSESYRHMCRFESGFFFEQDLMKDYEWYWRVEPSIKYYCDIDYDVFKYMSDNDKKYGFTLSLYEYKETIPTLWDSVQKFMDKHPEHIASDNSMGFLSDDGGRTYNHCHFWSNFEVGNLNWLRSDAYRDYFDFLDKEGGFFYERWGDAPVHSIAAALMLPKDQIHFFEDIAYWHVPFTHCPNDEQERLDRKCNCNPSENFDWNGYSCTARFYDLNGMEKPDNAKSN